MTNNPSTAKSVIGVDIGGTKIACAVVNGRAEVSACHTLPTLAQDGYDASIAQVFAAIDRCWTSDVGAIGICAPGPLNPKTGVVFNPPNLPGWSNVPLASITSQRYGVPCVIENDANAAGLAEVRFGAARGYSSVVYATLSTGIGTGFIIDGKIYHGKNGTAAEGGHITIDYRSPSICNCGTPGCIEVLASGSALHHRGIDPAAITESQLDELGVMLGAWLGSVVSLLDPEIIVIGGGMSRIGEPLFQRLRREMPLRTINQFASATPIVQAELRENCGVVGAAAVALDIQA